MTAKNYDNMMGLVFLVKEKYQILNPPFFI